MMTSCSASQLALASIAIRIALVEVLSPRNRLMVFDDPTAALSREQSRRLAQYIGRLADGGGAQLIIASSDCYFVSLLEEHASSHYEVSLNKSYFSVATRKDSLYAR